MILHLDNICKLKYLEQIVNKLILSINWWSGRFFLPDFSRWIWKGLKAVFMTRFYAQR
jgi:hypothetical protein